MKKYIIILALFNCLIGYGQEFTLTTTNTKVSWTGYAELGSFKQEGSIKIESGALLIENDLIKSAQVIIDMKTIEHADQSLSDHLSKKDFFWSKKYPTATLESTSISCKKITGNLSIRGITQVIQFPYEMVKEGGKTIITGKMIIDRTLYDIKYNSSSYFQDLGNYAIKNEFELSFKMEMY